VYLGLYYLFASIIAFAICILNSFFWNNRYVFKNDANQKRSIASSLVKTYVSYAFTGLFLQNLLLALFIELLKFSKYIAPLFCLIITIPLNFILNKLWAFKSVKNTSGQIE
jgi:putative flippase GtrA